MAWMSLHTGLSAQLERRRRTERVRERAAQVGPYVGATASLAAAAGVLAALVLAGGSQPPAQQPSPFALPRSGQSTSSAGAVRPAPATTRPTATTSPTTMGPTSSAATNSTSYPSTTSTTIGPTTSGPTTTGPASPTTTAPG